MPSKKFLVGIDLTLNEIQNAILQVLGSDPGSAQSGRVYWNSTIARPKFGNGTTFIDLTDRSQHSGTQAWATISGAPTTLTGYGITDAQPLSAELTGVAALSTNGFVKRIGSGSYSIDNSVYLTGNQSITLTGDASGSGSTSIAVTLANSGVTAGTYNNSTTAVKPFTVDAKGRITSVGADVTILPAWGSISGKPTTVSGYAISDAYTKSEIDNLLEGRDPKGSVIAATTANITLSGTQTVDGVALVATNRVLVKNQTLGQDNGIYAVAAGAWTRTTDANDSSNVHDGITVWVEQGTTQGESSWTMITNGTITVGTTAQVWTQTSGAGQITAGTGLTKTGNTLSLANTAVSPAAYGSATAAPTFTVDAQGRLTAAGSTTVTPAWTSITSKPTTLAGYAISDAQPLDGDLTAIAALAGTTGLARKTAANTWSLDTAAYLTGNQTVTLSGDATGSGATAITVTLANSGVTAGTWAKVTVDAKGRVTVGAALIAADIPTLTAAKISDFTTAARASFTNGTGIASVSAGTVAIDTSVVTRKFSATIGDGTTTSIVVTHNLGTKDVMVNMRDVASDAIVEADVVATTTNTVTCNFTTAPTTGQFRAMVIG